jgi:hypothetical protein
MTARTLAGQGGGKPSPFEIDAAILCAARKSGYSQVLRRPVVNVDKKQLPKAYLHATPDYAAIRAALIDGREIPGAELTTEVVYVLSRPDAQDGDA